MKINKKLIVPFFASVTGLSIAGGLGGAFAWYQFNSQVRTGFIGTSTADTGLLQIGHMGTSGIEWGRDYFLQNTNLVPVTFGELVRENPTEDPLTSSLPLKANAYGYPESGKQAGSDYTSGWKLMENKKGYYQYDIYLRALKADPAAPGDPSKDIDPGFKLVEQDVYISEMTLEDANHLAGQGVDEKTEYITDALRVHIDVEGGRKDLISRKEIDKDHALALSGTLDLDGDGNDDTYDVDPWDSNYGNPVTYGISGEKQITKGIDQIVQKRDNGMMPATANAKRICRTKTGESDMVKITVTVWLEGWALLKTAEATGTEAAKYSNIWDPTMNAGMKVHVGMVFDVGYNILG